VRQLLAQIDSAELTEWRAYYALEPFGELVADQRHGIAVSTLANVNRDVKRHPDPYRPTDFIPWSEVHLSSSADGAVLMPDAEQQSRLIKQLLFKAK
jgi:hypothetical protein